MFYLDFSIFLYVKEFIYDKWEETSSNFALIHFSINFEKDDNHILILSIFKMNYFNKEIYISFIIIINELLIYLIIILYIFFNYFLINLKVSFFTSIDLFIIWIMMIIIKMKIKIIKKYLQDLQNYHIDMNFDKSIFNDSHLKRIIRDKKRYYRNINK